MGLMEPYFIMSWKRQLKGAALKRAVAAIRAIDDEAELVCVNIPGNETRMWLERPNDGTNNDNSVRAEALRLIAIVNHELDGKQRGA